MPRIHDARDRTDAPARPGGAVLELREFGVGFGGRTVLSSVDVLLPQRGVTVLLGPTAGGKSALLRTLAGYNASQPAMRTWGTARYRGRPLDFADPPACPSGRSTADRPALVMQRARLLLGSVLENLVDELPDRSLLTRGQQADWAVGHLRSHGLDVPAGGLGGEVIALSPGMQRCLAMLRTAAAGPALLLLDETTADLPDEEADRVLGLVHRLAERRSVLMVTHNAVHARRLAGMTVLLAGGRVWEHRPTDAFFLDPHSVPARQYVRTGSCAVPGPDTPPEELDDEWRNPTVSVDESVSLDMQRIDDAGNHGYEASAGAERAADEDSPPHGTDRSDDGMVELSSDSGGAAGGGSPPARDDRGPDDDSMTDTESRMPSEDQSGRIPSSDLPVRPPIVFEGPVHPPPRGFRWLRPGLLGGLPRPGLLEDVDADLRGLVGLGVRSLVTLEEEPFDPVQLAGHGIEGLFCPIPDMHAPALPAAADICARIRRRMDRGRPVGVHCRGGLGRTGTILTAMLIWEGTGAREALEAARRIEPAWVQSQVQVEFLRNFALVHRGRGASSSGDLPIAEAG